MQKVRNIKKLLNTAVKDFPQNLNFRKICDSVIWTQQDTKFKCVIVTGTIIGFSP